MKFHQTTEEYVKSQEQRLELIKKHSLPTEGLVLKVYLPDETHNIKGDPKKSVTHEVEQIEINSLGITGDRHNNLYVKSNAREIELYSSKTTIRNNRHIFVVSENDCEELLRKIGVKITPELLGANILVGIKNNNYPLTEIPQEAHLVITESNAELPKPPLAVLVRHCKQEGCGITGKAIAEQYGRMELSAKFIENSKDNRGIVCKVEYPTPEENKAVIKPGMKIFFRYTSGVTS